MHPGVGRWIRRMMRELEGEELQAMAYFLREVSVGELVAVSDLRLSGVRDPAQVIRSLVAKGFLERGEGYYNLPAELRKSLMEMGGSLPEAGRRVAERLERLVAPWATA